MDWWERCERRNIFASGGVGIGGFNVGIGGDGVDGVGSGDDNNDDILPERGAKTKFLFEKVYTWK